MKKLISVLGGIFVSMVLVSQGASAFSDVSRGSSLYPAVQDLINRDLIDDGAFFKPSANVPASMFWQIALLDSGFDPNSFEPETAELPKNITANDTFAPFVAEAVRLGFIDTRLDFDANQGVNRMEALKVLLSLKEVSVSNRVSPDFRKKVQGISSKSKNLVYFEAGYASKILEDSDLLPVRPFGLLNRRDFANWIWRFNDHGLKKSKIDSGFDKEEYLRKKEELENKENNEADQDGDYPDSTKKPAIHIKILPMDGGNSATHNSNLPDGDILEAVFAEIEKDYRFTDVLTTEKKEDMINAAIAAMVKEIGDQYSSFIVPEKSEDFRNGLDGQFEGIGAFVEMINNKFTITSPIKGSPAEAAGLLTDDVVVKVDGEAIAEKEIHDSIALIKGPAGTSVNLTILRDDKEQEITVVRGEITVPSVTIEWNKSVPVIGIHQFNNDTSKLFSEILNNEVLPKNPKGIVFDLRNNPGGFLTSAVDMGEFFIDQNDLVFSVEFRDNVKRYTSTRRGELYDLWKNQGTKIVVLQNKGSASAAEIFTAMIQDHKIGKVVGTVSRGKGTVQEIKNYSNGGILKLTIAKWLSPNNRWIHETGITPDIEVEDPSAEDKENKIDPQLERALAEILY